MDETFNPPTDDDFKAAWSAVHFSQVYLGQEKAAALARVIYAAERARKLLAGVPTCAERDQT